MKFKIHTKEVRRAAKKKNLKINSGLTVQKEDYNNYTESCPIGAIYCKAKDIDTNDENAVWEADTNAIPWAQKRYGKYYVDGFVEGFDEPGELNLHLEINRLKGSAKKNYSDGYRNGELLARYLLD